MSWFECDEIRAFVSRDRKVCDAIYTVVLRQPGTGGLADSVTISISTTQKPAFEVGKIYDINLNPTEVVS